MHQAAPIIDDSSDDEEEEEEEEETMMESVKRKASRQAVFDEESESEEEEREEVPAKKGKASQKQAAKKKPGRPAAKKAKQVSPEDSDNDVEIGDTSCTMRSGTNSAYPQTLQDSLGRVIPFAWLGVHFSSIIQILMLSVHIGCT